MGTFVHRGDYGANGGKEHDGAEVAKEIFVVERVAGFEEDGRHKIEEKDGVKLLARPPGVFAWNCHGRSRSVSRWRIRHLGRCRALE